MRVLRHGARSPENADRAWICIGDRGTARRFSALPFLLHPARTVSETASDRRNEEVWRIFVGISRPVIFRPITRQNTAAKSCRIYDSADGFGFLSANKICFEKDDEYSINRRRKKRV